MSIYGAEPVGDLAEFFVLYEDGSVGRLQVTQGEQPPALARAGRFVSRQEYLARLDELNTATAEHVGRLLADDEERTRGDYLELRGAGIRDESARRMSGYQGPDVAPAEAERN
ncbi:hypothetical protein [Streptomyces sp. KAU_LT]|uniref:hypothetical protein n=1 Tax=Streptomyces sp. KAU_LT TaxID=3046669 RepID=UPI0024B76D00|nr:hypothetical protein [Streptomyces sp. KAU_LT]MDI9829675.1 hypothetical protein [Streptomyces sp. KAU_LT]